uniref:Uncharacterized protein n=1 Tax=Setaria viridis TaxID=4556 RepID=A0A4U6TIF2_SETVI|nr:hypothetical protein SEVIR_8G129400v2 [Setaria viridis]
MYTASESSSLSCFRWVDLAEGQGNGMEDTSKVMLSIMILELALAERICVRDAAVEMHSIDTGSPC